MESKDELKSNNIKNRTCYDFDDIMKIEDINICLEEKSYENILFLYFIYIYFI